MKTLTKRLIISAAVTLLAVTLLMGGFFIYISDYYHADADSVLAYKSICEENIVFNEGIITIEPDGATAGLIFYPGGKVEYSAYLPLMVECAQRRILCVLVEMPYNLAVLDVNAADGICDKYPEIEHWYIGGHSLGGSMAASYIEKNSDLFDGLILLGAYSTADLASGSVDVLSIYGSEDGVMNREKYEKYKENLPSDLNEHVIEGGSHAYFGTYGEQKGDGTAAITNEEQMEYTAELIEKFIFG